MNFLKPNKYFSRRTMLKGLGVSTAILPLLEAEVASSECLSAPPKRLLLVFWGNGLRDQNIWAPADQGALPGFLSSLEPHRDDLIFLKGVAFKNLHDTDNPCGADSAGHGATPAVWTGTRYSEFCHFKELAGGPSIDHNISNELRRQGKFDRGPLHLGVRWEGYHMSWRGAGDAAGPDNDPFHAFDTLFANVGVGAGEPDPALQQLRRARKSVLDRVSGDLTRLCKNLGAEDRARCEAHLQSVRDLETELSNGVTVACEAPQLTRGFDPFSDDGTPQTFKAQLDIAVSALASDAARVALVTFGSESNNHILPTWMGLGDSGEDGGTGDGNSHHSIAHSGDDRKTQLDTWHYEQMAALFKKLKETREPDGSRMIDNTTVVVANNQDTGGGHGTSGVPWILAGNSGGYFKTGQSLHGDFAHTDVLNAVCESMEVDIEGYTQPEYRGLLSSLKA